MDMDEDTTEPERRSSGSVRVREGRRSGRTDTATRTERTEVRHADGQQDRTVTRAAEKDKERKRKKRREVERKWRGCGETINKGRGYF